MILSTPMFAMLNESMNGSECRYIGSPLAFCHKKRQSAHAFANEGGGTRCDELTGSQPPVEFPWPTYLPVA
jgi:hypothetical protein